MLYPIKVADIELSRAISTFDGLEHILLVYPQIDNIT